MFELIVRLKRLRQDENGAIAIVFALCLLVVIFMIGAALDTGRAVQASGHVASALDAASLAAAKAMAEDDKSASEARDIAERVFAAHINEAGNGLVWSNFRGEISKPDGRVKIFVDTSVPTTFTRVFGYKGIDMRRSATAIYKLRDLELALVLDVTGSMGDDGKIDTLKLAAKELVDIVLEDDFNPHTRVSLAPYSAAVNVGAYAAAATNEMVRLDNCVLERNAFGHAYREDAPGPGRYFGYVPDAVSLPDDIDPTSGAQPGFNAYMCPDAVILPLSNSRTQIKDQIESFNVNGWTAGHLGAAWGWYLLSPEWSSIWPAASRPKAYEAPNLTKAVLFMTDGEFNTAYAHEDSAPAAIKLCDEMKLKNIVIYTIAFKAPEEAAATLRTCATSEGHFFDAESSDALRDAFKSIAGQLSALRISD
jgi:Flp pilus assembly protein TadG